MKSFSGGDRRRLGDISKKTDLKRKLGRRWERKMKNIRRVLQEIWHLNKGTPLVEVREKRGIYHRNHLKFLEQKDLGFQFERTHWVPCKMEEKRPSSKHKTWNVKMQTNTEIKNNPNTLQWGGGMGPKPNNMAGAHRQWRSALQRFQGNDVQQRP